MNAPSIILGLSVLALFIWGSRHAQREREAAETADESPVVAAQSFTWPNCGGKAIAKIHSDGGISKECLECGVDIEMMGNWRG